MRQRRASGRGMAGGRGSPHPTRARRTAHIPGQAWEPAATSGKGTGNEGGRPASGWRAGVGARAVRDRGAPPTFPGRHGSLPLRPEREPATRAGVQQADGGRAWEPAPHESTAHRPHPRAGMRACRYGRPCWVVNLPWASDRAMADLRGSPRPTGDHHISPPGADAEVRALQSDRGRARTFTTALSDPPSYGRGMPRPYDNHPTSTTGTQPRASTRDGDRTTATPTWRPSF